MIDFKLDPKSGVPFYRQIIDLIRHGIATGRYEMIREYLSVSSAQCVYPGEYP